MKTLNKYDDGERSKKSSFDKWIPNLLRNISAVLRQSFISSRSLEYEMERKLIHNLTKRKQKIGEASNSKIFLNIFNFILISV